MSLGKEKKSKEPVTEKREQVESLSPPRASAPSPVQEDENIIPKSFHDFINLKKAKRNYPVQLSKENESEAKRIAAELARALNDLFAFALRLYLTTKGVIQTSSSIDPLRYLKMLSRSCEINPSYFGKAPTHGNVTHEELIDIAIDGRNAVCHNDLSVIFINWEIYLKAWIEVTLLMKNNDAANKLKTALKAISGKNRRSKT